MKGFLRNTELWLKYEENRSMFQEILNNLKGCVSVNVSESFTSFVKRNPFKQTTRRNCKCFRSITRPSTSRRRSSTGTFVNTSFPVPWFEDSKSETQPHPVFIVVTTTVLLRHEFTPGYEYGLRVRGSGKKGPIKKGRRTKYVSLYKEGYM